MIDDGEDTIGPERLEDPSKNIIGIDRCPSVGRVVNVVVDVHRPACGRYNMRPTYPLSSFPACLPPACLPLDPKPVRGGTPCFSVSNRS